MTATRVPELEHASLFRGIAVAAGVILLADSISQLIQAAGALDVGNRNWRVANLRLLFTQVTPLVMGLLLVGQHVTRSASGWRRVGWVALVLGVVVLVLATIYVWDAGRLGAIGQLRRSTAQVLLSGGVFGLGLLTAGVLSLRTKPS